MLPVHHCEEKKELASRIHQCVSILDHRSKRAAELAESFLPDTLSKFHAVQTEIFTETVRLQTLRECLAFHQQIHGC